MGLTFATHVVVLQLLHALELVEPEREWRTDARATVMVMVMMVMVMMIVRMRGVLVVAPARRVGASF